MFIKGFLVNSYRVNHVLYRSISRLILLRFYLDSTEYALLPIIMILSIDMVMRFDVLFYINYNSIIVHFTYYCI